MKEETKCYCGHTTYCDCGPETLEEAISRIKSENEHYIDEEAFELGAKWQEERSYSEEDLKEVFGMNDKDWICFEEWFEQFKKK